MGGGHSDGCSSGCALPAKLAVAFCFVRLIMRPTERKGAILRPMQADPIEEWRKLRELYSEMSDEELHELAIDFVDLTESAQQVLRDEMKNRGLGEPRAAGDASKDSARLTPPGWDPDVSRTNAAGANREGGLPHEYTWKTLLCACDEWEEAWQISEALRRAGIESWMQGPGSGVRTDLSTTGVLVAADQLDEAREIAARPIPQEIIDESKTDSSEFEPPACPRCGAGDPVLEGVDPFNAWRCEACGKQWTESTEDPNKTPEKTG